MAVQLAYIDGHGAHQEPLFEYTSEGMHLIASDRACAFLEGCHSKVDIGKLGAQLFSYSQALRITARNVAHLRPQRQAALEASVEEFLRDGVVIVSDRFAKERGIMEDSDVGIYHEGISYIRAEQTVEMIAETHTHEGAHAIVDLLGLECDPVIGEMYPISLERKHHGKHQRYRNQPHATAERLVHRLESAYGRRATLPQLWGVLRHYHDSRMLSRDLTNRRLKT